jgi:putative heme-binding domain-containing protein
MPDFRPLALLALLALPAAAQHDAPAPEWIWSVPHVRDGQEGWFRRDFEIDVGTEIASARLFATADNHVEVWLDGERIGVSDEWWQPVERDVTEHVRAGANALCAWAKNDDGPAGLLIRLEVALTSGETVRIVTDDTWPCLQDPPPPGWTAVEFRPSGWKLAKSFGALGVAPWGDLAGETHVGEPSESLPAERIELPDGFHAERLYSVPKGRQGSWVSVCADDRGRLYASDQYGGLYRVTPPPIGEPGETLVEETPVELGAAQGLLWAFDSLYVVVNGAAGFASGLYRVRDTDGDDVLDDVSALRHFDGSGEHGPHAIRIAPDGESLFLIFGNHVDLPEIDRSRVPRVWSEDLLLPRLPDPNGHAVGRMAPGGFVLVTDPDGQEWELYACGFRNAYDFDFDEHGELLTFDSDMEWDIGMPWYRPTRILHVVSGADFGWRHGSGKWPSYWIDSLPAAVDIGLSSPTGVEHGRRSGWPHQWGRALYAADWSYGTIYAVQLVPGGSSYTGRAEVFLHGEPFPVTDMTFAGGAMYVTVGGRRVQSGLYRITFAGDRAAAEPPGFPVEIDSAAHANRHELEAWHAPRAEGLPEHLGWQLGQIDRFQAHAARTALEHQDPSRWAELVLAMDYPPAAIQGLVALLRAAPGEYAERVQERLLVLFESDLSAAEGLEPRQVADRMLGLLRAQELCFTRAGAPDAVTRAAVIAALDPLFPHTDPRVSRELCRLLVYLEAPSVLGKGLRLLEQAESQEEQIFYAHVLRNVRRGWTLDERGAWFRWINEAGAAFSGGHSFRRYLDAMRADVVATLTDGEREELGDALVQGIAAPTSAEVIPASFVRQWRLEELALGLSERVAESSDLEAGRYAFRKALCFECHRMGEEGGSTGPDLTRAVGRFSARDVLEAILEPSLVLSDQYQDTSIETDDGRFLVGRVESEDDEWISLRLGLPTEALVDIEKSQVVSRSPYPLSRMPSGLANVLTRGEIDALIAYVLSGE